MDLRIASICKTWKEHVSVALMLSDKVSQAGEAFFVENFGLFSSLWMILCGSEVIDS